MPTQGVPLRLPAAAPSDGAAIRVGDTRERPGRRAAVRSRIGQLRWLAPTLAELRSRATLGALGVGAFLYFSPLRSGLPLAIAAVVVVFAHMVAGQRFEARLAARRAERGE